MKRRRLLPSVCAEQQLPLPTRDAGIIVAAQKLEHYEITSYGSLAQHASTLDHDDVVEILELSLFEEKEADELLTAVAENYINKEASRE